MERLPSCNNNISPSDKNENVQPNKIQDSSLVGAISPVRGDAEKDAFLQSDHSIFTIDLIMIMLMKTLNQADLITCRQVSSSFNWFATYHLRTLPSFVLSFKYDLNTETFVFSNFSPYTHEIEAEDRSMENKSNNLTALTQLMSTSWSFPATSFKFTGGSLGNEDIQEFLNCQGNTLLSLSLDVHCIRKGRSSGAGYVRRREKVSTHYMDKEKEWPRISMLTNLLVHQASSLKSLLLDHCPDQWEGDLAEADNLFSAPIITSSSGSRVGNRSGFFMDKIKFLTLGKHVPSNVVRGIFDAAPNLQRADCHVGNKHYQNQYQALIGLNKCHLLHHFDFYPSPQNNVLYATKFIGSNYSKQLNFKSLSISMFELEDAAILDSTIHSRNYYYNLKLEASQLLNVVLQECASRLLHLTFHSSLSVLGDFVTNLKIPPTFPNVKSIKISNLEFHEFLLKNEYGDMHFFGYNNSLYKYSPPRISFQLKKNTFPCLTKVIFHIHRYHETPIWKGYFNNFKNVIPTVKFLTFSKADLFPRHFLHHCSRIFENVEVLEIRAERLEIVRNSRKGLWNFNRLKELLMDINLGHNQNINPHLDSAMTGISVKAISRVEDWSQLLLDNEGHIKNLRRYPSMIHLKDFRRMSLRFFDKGVNTRESYPLYLTRVAGELAFKKCPLLQVELTFDITNKGNLKHLLKVMSPIFQYVKSSSHLYQEDTC